jgi:tetratricopeptide (TPR) repeat protein
MRLRTTRALVAALGAVLLLAGGGADATRASSGAEMAEADRLLVAGEYARAIDLYRSLDRSGDEGARLRLAAAYLKRDEAAAALGAADAAVTVAPTADAYAMRSLARFRAGRFTAAEQDRDRALTTSPRESAISHLANARLLAAKGRNAEALHALDVSLTSDAFVDRVFRVDALLLRADVLDDLDRPEEALKAHDLATAIAPRTNDVLVANLRAQAAFRRSAIGRPLYRVADGPSSSETRLAVHHGLPVVYISVNGHAPEPFIVDTGAGISVIFPAAAKRLGLEARSEPAWAGAVGGEGRVPIRYALAERVGIGRTKVEHVPFAVIDWELPQISGLVGLPLLRPFLTTFDYRGGTLRLEREPRRRPRAGGRNEVAFRTVGGAIFVDAWVNEKGPFNFELDTGAAPTAVPIDERTADAVGLHPSQPNARRARGAGAGGGQEAVVYARSKIAWGGLDPVTVDVISQRITPARPERRQGESGLTSETEVEGLIGYALLAKSVLTIDFAAHTLTVR